MHTRLSVLFLSLVFLSVVSSALSIRIEKNPPPGITGSFLGVASRGFVIESTYVLKIMDEYTTTLNPEYFSGCSPDEAIIIESDDGQNVEILSQVSSRLIQILLHGWRPAFQWQPNPEIDPSLQATNPPSSFIFYYLLFGITNFSTGVNVASVALNSRSVQEGVLNNEILPYSILIVSNRGNFHEKDAFLYLGNNIFLSWKNIEGYFSLMSSEDIDASQIIQNPQLYQIMEANGIRIPMIQTLLAVFSIWQAVQASK